MLFRCRTLTPVVMVLLALAAPALAGQPGVDELINKMPAQSVEEGQKLAAQLLQLGPDAFRAVCAKVIDPAKGGDLKANAKARYALHALATWCSRPDAAAERKQIAGLFVQAVNAAEPPEVKKFFIRQLQLAGTEDAVPPLAALLDSDAYDEPATQALIEIGGPDAVQELLKALPSAKGARRVTLVRALGRLRAKGAVQEILKHVGVEDRTHRLVALWALANIGDPAAASALQKAAEVKGVYERAQATSILLLFARRLAEGDHKDRAAAICRQLIKDRKAPAERQVISAALRTLATAVGTAAADDLMAALESPDKQIRAAALRCSDSIPGEAFTARLVGHMKQATPAMRVRILDTLGQRGDRTALPAVLDALKDSDKAVRIAAVGAAAQLGGKDALTPLLARLGTDQADEAEALQRAIVGLQGDEVSAAIAKAVPDAPVAARAAMLDILAARGATAHLDTVLKAAKDEEESVRVAAIGALAVLAEPSALPTVVDLLLAAKTNRERTTALRVLVSLARRIEDQSQRADAVLAALKTAEGEPRTVLHQALARLGGAEALAAVVADAKSEDEAVRKSAIRAMADWPDASAAPELLKIARFAKDLTEHVIALRGYVRLVRDADGLAADRKVGLLKEAMDAAKRPEETKLVLGALGTLRSVAALAAAAAHFGDEALAQEAAAAAVSIACPRGRRDKGLRGDKVADILQKAAEVTKNADVRKKAEAHLKSLKK
jgi:HEAT repeat protein